MSMGIYILNLSIGYNPINQAYEQSERGEKLKNYD